VRRFRSLERKGKRRTVIATAIARELFAFIWAINREIMRDIVGGCGPLESYGALDRPTAPSVAIRFR